MISKYKHPFFVRIVFGQQRYRVLKNLKRKARDFGYNLVIINELFLSPSEP